MIRRRVGCRYSANYLTVHIDGEDPCLDRPEDLAEWTREDGRRRKLVFASDLHGETRRWYRTDWVWLDPGEAVEFSGDLPGPRQAETAAPAIRATLRCAAAPGKAGRRPPEKTVESLTVPYRIFFNGREWIQGEKYFGAMPPLIPLLEEIHVRIPSECLVEQSVRLRLQNDSTRDFLLLARIYLEEVSDRTMRTAFRVPGARSCAGSFVS